MEGLSANATPGIAHIDYAAAEAAVAAVRSRFLPKACTYLADFNAGFRVHRGKPYIGGRSPAGLSPWFPAPSNLNPFRGEEMKVRLVSYDDCTPQRKITVDKLPAVIGRSPDADVQLDDRWVSRVHCEISEIDGTLVARDLESMNGTLVNGNSVTDSPLLPGDTLTIGIARFEVYYKRHKSKSSSGSGQEAASCPLQELGIRFPLLPVPRANRPLGA